ncbi:MAG TPA: AMP-binding protein [Polyangiaceae bacterium]|nr:AMP-binding protein [Polyangiaceae bacterium]
MTDSPLLARWLARADDPRPIAHDAGGTTAWAQAVHRADRIACGLLDGRASLEGERVALLVSPGAAFVECLFGVLRAGGCAVILSPIHPPPETSYFCGDAGVRTVIVSRDFADRAAFLAPERRVVQVDSLRDASGGHVRTVVPGASAALQLYTSGTTGKPKGAIITHANLAEHQRLLQEAWAWQPNDVLLHVLPLHHLHGLGIAMLTAIGAGAATRFLAGFDARATWAAMAEATVFMGVPTVHAKLFAAFDEAEGATRARWEGSARALRLVTSGSAALPVSVGDRWKALTGAYPLERFGMTEIGVGMSNPLAPAARRPATVGPPLPTVGTRVVGEDGGDADAGELWISGPSVFDAYHARPEATRDAFTTRGGVRWFKTGDTVARDPDGYLRVLGRTSVDILKSGGYKLSALEIEESLREHPAVAEVAVVGVPDAMWGDRVVACVVAHAGREADCDEVRLRAFAKERLAPYKVPKQVVVMQSLPRNPIGKVVKPELVALLRDA